MTRPRPVRRQQVLRGKKRPEEAQAPSRAISAGPIVLSGSAAPTTRFGFRLNALLGAASTSPTTPCSAQAATEKCRTLRRKSPGNARVRNQRDLEFTSGRWSFGARRPVDRGKIFFSLFVRDVWQAENSRPAKSECRLSFVRRFVGVESIRLDRVVGTESGARLRLEFWRGGSACSVALVAGPRRRSWISVFSRSSSSRSPDAIRDRCLSLCGRRSQGASSLIDAQVNSAACALAGRAVTLDAARAHRRRGNTVLHEESGPGGGRG